jgi:glycosyltransferase involved in cell wall biosynthesis
MTRFVSIAMATCNGARYLQEQLDSFVCQTHQPDELVVTDDGSTDETLQILERFQAGAPFAVRVDRNETRLGVAKNFERAMSLCSGDIIFLSDQDDVWFPHKIETVVGEFERAGSIYVVINDQLITDGALRSSGVTKLENVLSMGMNESAFRTGCCTTIARCWTPIALPIPVHSTHDVWINGLSELLGARRVLRQPLQYYRRHGGNASNWLASRAGRVSELDVIWLHRLKDASDGWRKDRQIKHAYLARLRQRETMLKGLGLEHAAETAILLLQQEISASEARTRLVEVPRWRRGPGLLRFLLDGGYGHFAGWKSAVKDLIR